MQHEKGDSYHVTGVDVAGKRFKIITDNLIHAMAINLWRGTVWQIKAGKTKRRRIKVVWRTM
jgi:hypothetical protein